GCPNTREVLGEELDAGAGGKPRVEARRLAQRRRPAATDPDRRPTGARRLRLHGDVVEREVLAVKPDVVAAPEGAADLERLEKAAHAAVPRHAGGGELLPDRGRVGGDGDAEDDAALGHAIERADHVSE